MNAIGLRQLYAAGITSPAMVGHLIDDATAKAHTPRITPSRRVRRWKRAAFRLVVAGVAIAALYVRGVLA